MKFYRRRLQAKRNFINISHRISGLTLTCISPGIVFGVRHNALILVVTSRLFFININPTTLRVS